ncbi:GrpB family protein [Bacillus sp. DX1.1]|uniref:GrpB family protein n=1 Tax=unclassified Bacillus (in: firmicutes) TaxID=185979 RepID=UPI00256FF015|nr:MULTISPECIES: GrpB family protein [unclassified Bacillus (in: firmicutes)]MDM5155115.1 GrpB family protein [Bacillus sp. DX1.1]WJE79444.1 GrpB family protein [Bacillus sp. DX3.1]
MDKQIIIEPYNPNWHTEFIKEKEKFIALFNNDIVAIEHIGSTSVEGLGAKPLIDMMIGVNDLKQVEQWIELLQTIGYEHVFHKNIPNRRFFRKGKWRAGTHHLHVYIYNSEEWNNNLLFRDYMKTNEWARMKYRQLKQVLAAKYPFDRVAYTNEKAPFIQQIIAIAKENQQVKKRE